MHPDVVFTLFCMDMNKVSESAQDWHGNKKPLETFFDFNLLDENLLAEPYYKPASKGWM